MFSLPDLLKTTGRIVTIYGRRKDRKGRPFPSNPKAFNFKSKDWGIMYQYDLSMLLPELYKVFEDARQRLTFVGLVDQSEKYPVVSIVGWAIWETRTRDKNIAYLESWSE
ncbi:MAG: hypothetical protein ALECFALPRED_007545 [Alectoria fallacina]|uniref:Uncharacterized protein n=1 Tax=Alectoria fallacina TaxID=1903189 RepID=A0A8H3IAZ7_9LECA|nr:MAG: hypothetical protein ALECFALPRED_007545 [Alectoria fallacina]